MNLGSIGDYVASNLVKIFVLELFTCLLWLVDVLMFLINDLVLIDLLVNAC